MIEKNLKSLKQTHILTFLCLGEERRIIIVITSRMRCTCMRDLYMVGLHYHYKWIAGGIHDNRMMLLKAYLLKMTRWFSSIFVISKAINFLRTFGWLNLNFMHIFRTRHILEKWSPFPFKVLSGEIGVITIADDFMLTHKKIASTWRNGKY